MNPLLMRMS